MCEIIAHSALSKFSNNIFFLILSSFKSRFLGKTKQILLILFFALFPGTHLGYNIIKNKGIKK